MKNEVSRCVIFIFVNKKKNIFATVALLKKKKRKLGRFALIGKRNRKNVYSTISELQMSVVRGNSEVMSSSLRTCALWKRRCWPRRRFPAVWGWGYISRWTIQLLINHYFVYFVIRTQVKTNIDRSTWYWVALVVRYEYGELVFKEWYFTWMYRLSTKRCLLPIRLWCRSKMWWCHRNACIRLSG